MNSNQIGSLVRAALLPLFTLLGLKFHLDGSMIALAVDSAAGFAVIGWSMWAHTNTQIIASAAEVPTPSGGKTEIKTDPAIAAVLGPNVTSKM